MNSNHNFRKTRARHNFDRFTILFAFFGIIFCSLWAILNTVLQWIPIPARSVQTYDVNLLWEQEIDLGINERIFFFPEDETVIFWDSSKKLLMGLNYVTGEIIWTSEAPTPSAMRIYDDKIFVVSDQWVDQMIGAPYFGDAPKCTRGQDMTLLAFDLKTGDRIWGWVYPYVDDWIYFGNQSVYLEFDNRSTPIKTLARIDINSGMIFTFECIRKSTEVAQPINLYAYSSGDQGGFGWTEEYLSKDDNRVYIYSELGREVGSIYFIGKKLPGYINSFVDEDLLLIYLNDSNQFFGFKFSR